ncbi:MAG: hypothetical protein ABI771_14565 [Betaproteobacteria bacterium]
MNAPINIFIRASDGRLLVRPGHAALRASSAVTGEQVVTVDGQPQRGTKMSLDAYEWLFPTIDAAPTAKRINGTKTQPINGSVGPMQAGGSTGTATCTWDFLALDRNDSGAPALGHPTSKPPVVDNRPVLERAAPGTRSVIGAKQTTDPAPQSPPTSGDTAIVESPAYTKKLHFNRPSNCPGLKDIDAQYDTLKASVELAIDRAIRALQDEFNAGGTSLSLEQQRHILDQIHLLQGYKVQALEKLAKQKELAIRNVTETCQQQSGQTEQARDEAVMKSLNKATDALTQSYQSIIGDLH